ncbi:MAG: tRNA pseudouridine(38-40) synthase TruA [Bacteroidales bacterium]|nr:tRNA pseudouridine(38-40) synthase TruA [Bacteroidales bacterium]MCL2133565.1 tRNA pseudouridine(38-40) synthase TruA [Bacteroidales bacterium]
MRYFIYLSFNGAHYHGWQQQENAATVQEALNRTLSVLLKEDIQTLGAGRTDAGVHARNYVAHFDSERLAYLSERLNVVYKLNCILPDDICIHRIVPVHDTAHARFDARLRIYKYYVHLTPNPFVHEFSTYIPYNLDIAKMNEAAAKLREYDDFSSFARLHSDNKTNICKILQAEWEEKGDNLVFTIAADRFLRNMVRAIVGTLLEAGRGKITVSDFAQIIERRERGAAGTSAPAKGLFLEEIRYDYVVFE